ncbi:hypothetical protein QP162_00235 [Sphingomonas aurantiaca]|uniref:hypothetical protein n=1 Tax=Sphingomonas aurantiaca TaxID=185949 RepID=UPI002FDF7B22
MAIFAGGAVISACGWAVGMVVGLRSAGKIGVVDLVGDPRWCWCGLNRGRALDRWRR